MSKAVTILLADDHPVVCRGLKAVIEDEESLRVVAEVANGQEALEQMIDLRPDVAVLDIDMPQLDGLAVAAEVLKRGIETKIIFLTFHGDEQILRMGMEVSGRGYLLKESAMEEVVSAINAVLAGRTYLCSAMVEKMIQADDKTSRSAESTQINHLTLTEKKILHLIGEGQSSKEIGEALSMNYRTVDNHRTNICRKLKIDGASSLLRFALKHRAVLYKKSSHVSGHNLQKPSAGEV